MTANRNSARNLLILLLSADAAFILLHFVHCYTSYAGASEFSLERDRGHAEVFQYVKWYWIVLMLLRLSARTRQIAFTFWAMLFGYLLIDDACRIHENVGVQIAESLGYTPRFGLRAEDFGELTVGVCVAATFIISISSAYLLGTDEVRKVSKRLFLCLGMIIFFGVVVDMLHVLGSSLSVVHLISAFEDGGEMLAASVTCWYVFSLLEPEGREPFPTAGKIIS